MKADNKKHAKTLPDNAIFALDIGTRSIIGVVGVAADDKIKILAVEKEEHTTRAMVDGQIEDIEQVAKVAGIVKARLEEKLNGTLERVCVAAAGRALRTEKACYELELPQIQKIEEETISRLEAGAIGEAEALFSGEDDPENRKQFYLVGYSVIQYYLDHYPISSLKDHRGKKLKAEVIATFLPSEVVESLYTTMNKIGLDVASLTLEPIAAINAAIPQNLRLLNLALVDVGAGTSDIAICRDGSVVGYTMATVAGDEITETLMKQYLVDFDTAERIKFELGEQDRVQFTDILGLEQTISANDILSCVEEASQSLCKEIAERILEVNDKAPSAVFLAGGGSKLPGMRESVAKYLKMDITRVALAGNNFQINAFSDHYEINNPEYATPLGIVISAGLNLINDSCHVILNGTRAKLFRNGSLTVLDVLMMNGFTYQDLLGRSGQSIVVQLDGKRIVFYGTHAVPAVLCVNEKEAKVSDIICAGDRIEFVAARHGEGAQATLKDLLGDEWNEGNVLVNGELVTENLSLKTGDVIMTEESYESEPVKIEPEAAVEQELLPEQVEEQNAARSEQLPDSRMSCFMLNDKPLLLSGKSDGNPYYLMDMLEYSDIDFENPGGEVVLKVNGVDSYFGQELKDNDTIQIYCR